MLVEKEKDHGTENNIFTRDSSLRVSPPYECQILVCHLFVDCVVSKVALMELDISRCRWVTTRACRPPKQGRGAREVG